MKKIATVLILVIVLGLMAGCYTTVHKVGNGSQTGTVVEARQWYAIWGLVPIGEQVDSQTMANGAADYEVTTQFTFIDMLISAFTNAVSINCQTVKVKQ